MFDKKRFFELLAKTYSREAQLHKLVFELADGTGITVPVARRMAKDMYSAWVDLSDVVAEALEALKRHVTLS